MDLKQYLSAGCSYDAFLKAFKAPVHKSFFCYEYLDSFSKLNEEKLPDYEHFYSSLKEVNVLEEAFCTWSRLSDEEKREIPRPLTGEQQYSKLQEIWREKGMKTLKDFLCFYNQIDVEPAMIAIKNMLNLFAEDGITDPFKSSISAPGLARAKLFQTAAENNVNFALIGSEDIDLYHTIQKNICGGPSIIYSRYHSKDETYIRSNPEKVCKTIEGYDAN